MAALPATFQKNKTLLQSRDASRLRDLLLERGELAARDLLGVSRHVALRAAANLYIDAEQAKAISDALKKVPGHNP